MANPIFVKVYEGLLYNINIKKLKDSSFRFLIYILLKSYKSQNKIVFKIKPSDIYSEFNTSHTKLWRIQQELSSIKIKIEYAHKFYKFDLSEFFKQYYPNHSKNETFDDNACS